LRDGPTRRPAIGMGRCLRQSHPLRLAAIGLYIRHGWLPSAIASAPSGRYRHPHPLRMSMLDASAAGSRGRATRCSRSRAGGRAARCSRDQAGRCSRGRAGGRAVRAASACAHGLGPRSHVRVSCTTGIGWRPRRHWFVWTSPVNCPFTIEAPPPPIASPVVHRRPHRKTPRATAGR
jgi:hypothetical protein